MLEPNLGKIKRDEMMSLEHINLINLDENK